MKIVTASNGKPMLRLNKFEWESIGQKAGWITATRNGLPVSVRENEFDKFLATLGYIALAKGRGGTHFKFLNTISQKTLTMVKQTSDPYYFVSCYTPLLDEMRKNGDFDHWQKTREFLLMDDKERKRFFRKLRLNPDSDEPIEEEPAPKNESWKQQDWYVRQQEALRASEEPTDEVEPVK